MVSSLPRLCHVYLLLPACSSYHWHLRLRSFSSCELYFPYDLSHQIYCPSIDSSHQIHHPSIQLRVCSSPVVSSDLSISFPSVIPPAVTYGSEYSPVSTPPINIHSTVDPYQLIHTIDNNISHINDPLRGPEFLTNLQLLQVFRYSLLNFYAAWEI